MRSFTETLRRPYSLIQYCGSKIPNVNVLPLMIYARGQFLMRSCRATGLCGSTKSAAGIGFFAFSAAVGRLCSGQLLAPTGSRSVTGFGVMESPDRRGSQPRERIPRQGGWRATLLCALRPWLREADAERTLVTGLAFCTLNPPPRSSLLIPDT